MLSSKPISILQDLTIDLLYPLIYAMFVTIAILLSLLLLWGMMYAALIFLPGVFVTDSLSLSAYFAGGVIISIILSICIIHQLYLGE